MKDGLQLRQWVFEGRTAGEVLELVASALAGEIEHGFAYTPGRAFFCTLHHEESRGFFGRLRGSRPEKTALVECDGSEDVKHADLGAVFEVMLFGAHYEARWERESGLKGRLSICSDSEAGENRAKARLDKLVAPAERPASLRDHCYLLWGEAAKKQPYPGRTKLTSARIGALWVPIDRSGERIVLTAREYFETKEFGNVVFAGERLTGLREARSADAASLGASL
jgi:CRISPR-associated protein (TIGR03984 family)